MPSPKDTHGPIVKTGPTAGQNRSRRKDGPWRRKRSDAGKKRQSKLFWRFCSLKTIKWYLLSIAIIIWIWYTKLSQFNSAVTDD